MITLSQGLLNSLIVLEHLRNNEDIKDIRISIGTFTNCRECGLTFAVFAENGETFTWCVYEHRNSDSIIINGKDGYITLNGDLPYCSDNKWQYLGASGCGEHQATADKLANMIIEYAKKNIEKENDDE